MKIIIRDTYKDISDEVARIVLGEFYQDKRINVALTDGNSPKGAYDIILPIMKKYKEDFTNVHLYNWDELNSKDRFIYNVLKKQIHIPSDWDEENIHSLDFESKNQYIKDIEFDGGLDLMVMGMGADGHFFANMPESTRFDEFIYEYDPSEYSWFKDLKDKIPLESTPRIATFGLKSALRCKRAILIVSGKDKAQAVYRMLNEEISTSCPSTALRLHPNITVIMDKDAASKL